jgi:thiol:disulfide interchange protein DsbD
MKKIIKLTESDLTRIVKRIIKEQSNPIEKIIDPHYMDYDKFNSIPGMNKKNNLDIDTWFQLHRIDGDSKINFVSVTENNPFSAILNNLGSKKLFVDVYADWCGVCKKMDKTTLSNPLIVKTINEKFISIKLNGEQDNKEFNKYRVNQFPSYLFIDSKGNVIKKIIGYKDPKSFYNEIKEI